MNAWGQRHHGASKGGGRGGGGQAAGAARSVRAAHDRDFGLPVQSNFQLSFFNVASYNHTKIDRWLTPLKPSAVRLLGSGTFCNALQSKDMALDGTRGSAQDE
ncbi:hypothetical protein HaLaN_05366 [Haematococcus lacustris]|uniref:Uncharacterized protein n=1 Tax=Haematococcus lacustris TaxID=44745 RepID=A0A699YJ36_HAELA|nr:hypothetical protein HaLaN_05366 [Haematococcus lacustris]